MIALIEIADLEYHLNISCVNLLESNGFYERYNLPEGGKNFEISRQRL